MTPIVGVIDSALWPMEHGVVRMECLPDGSDLWRRCWGGTCFSERKSGGKFAEIKPHCY